MKKIFAYMALAAAVTFAASCSREAAGPEFKGEDAISLSLVYEAPVTKSDAPGLESAVTSVEYFFYDVNGTLLYRKYDSSPELTENKYSVSLVVGEGVLESKSYNDFFPNGADCQFFAVFNYPEEIGDNTLENVKKKAVSNTFAHQEGDNWHVTQDADVALGYEKYFVMTGSATLSPNPAGITGTVDMRRIAAKITFVVNVAQSKTVDNTDVWTPMLTNNNPRIYLSNAVANALVGGADIKDETAGTAPIFPEDLGQFDYSPDVLDFNGGYTSTSPFYYTFPLAWEAGDDSEIYCKLIIPWKMERTEGGVITYSTERELYYKVLFPKTEIVANNHYVYTINADFLGREGEEPTITITAEKAIVLPWTTSGDVNPVVSAAKYLSVEKGVDKPEVTYTTGTTITYAASDEVSLVIKNIYQRNLTTRTDEYLIQNGNVVQSTINTRNNNKKPSEPNLTEAIIRGWINHDATHSVFELNHLLNSDLTSKNMDATPYTYEIELHLGPAGSETYNDSKYTKTVTIVQYPQVYVVEDPNSNNGEAGRVGIYINGNNTTSTQWNKGTGRRGYGGNIVYDDHYNLGGANGITADAGNKNPNMYVLTISVSDKYTIGDPRTTQVQMPEFRYRENNQSAWINNWKQGKWTEDKDETEHVLTYYHPASSENTSEMIAPKIRIASSYGVCQTGRTKEEAILRCATYQEDGIPAGRWRLPTYAEVEFMATMSSIGRIPYLFGMSSNNGQTPSNENTRYWTANGLIEVNNGNASGTVAPHVTRLPNATDATYTNESVRCVYDEWFWGDATTTRPAEKSEFTWGDRNY